MPDSDIPSFIDENEEDEATMMWNREEFDPDGDVLANGALESALRAPEAAPESKPAATGLDAADLFGDVLGDGEADAEVGLAAESLVDAAGTPAITDAPAAPERPVPVEIAPPKTTSLVAPAPPSRAGFWVGMTGVFSLALAAGAYVWRAHLGPVGDWIESLGLQELLGLPL